MRLPRILRQAQTKHKVRAAERNRGVTSLRLLAVGRGPSRFRADRAPDLPPEWHADLELFEKAQEIFDCDHHALPVPHNTRLVPRRWKIRQGHGQYASCWPALPSGQNCGNER